MAKRGKRRRVVVTNPDDNPLGIGLSTKTLVWVGVAVVGAVALKMYLDRRKQQAALAGLAGPQAGGVPPLPGERIVLPPNAYNGQPAAAPNMNGFGVHVPPSSGMPADGPPPGPPAGQLPQSPRGANGSRANYEGVGGFSGMGDGGLNGANSRL